MPSISPNTGSEVLADVFFSNDCIAQLSSKDCNSGFQLSMKLYLYQFVPPEETSTPTGGILSLGSPDASMSLISASQCISIIN